MFFKCGQVTTRWSWSSIYPNKTLSLDNGAPRWVPNVTGGEKSSLNRDSNPGPLAYCASALPTELLRPDILTDSHTNCYSAFQVMSTTLLPNLVQ